MRAGLHKEQAHTCDATTSWVKGFLSKRPLNRRAPSNRFIFTSSRLMSGTSLSRRCKTRACVSCSALASVHECDRALQSSGVLMLHPRCVDDGPKQRSNTKLLVINSADTVTTRSIQFICADDIVGKNCWDASGIACEVNEVRNSRQQVNSGSDASLKP